MLRNAGQHVIAREMANNAQGSSAEMLTLRDPMTTEPMPNLGHFPLFVVFPLQIGHAIKGCDVPSLFRDFGIVIINVVDTEVRPSIGLWMFAVTRRMMPLAC